MRQPACPGESVARTLTLTEKSWMMVPLTGAIEEVILKRDGNTGVPLNTGARLRYAIDYELSYEPGSEVYTGLPIRWGTNAQNANYIIQIDSLNENMMLLYQPNNPTGVGVERLTPRIPIPGLQTGRTFKITSIVDEGRYAIFLDDKLVADVADSRLDEPTIPNIWTAGVEGTLYVRGVRIYQLQSQTGTVTSSPAGGQPPSAPTSPATPPSPSPTASAPQEGLLVWEAKLDGSGADVILPR